jgi:hypothetical protein
VEKCKREERPGGEREGRREKGEMRNEKKKKRKSAS